MSGSGNGVDLGSIAAMLTNLLVIGEETRREIVEMKRDVGDLKRHLGNLEVKVAALGGEVADLRGEVAELRSEVRAYHGSVLAHGILLTELDERMTRVETHLNLPPKSH